MITLKMLITAWRTTELRCWANQPRVSRDAAGATCATSSVIERSASWTEDAQQKDHDEQHGGRADHADGGGIALAPKAGLERLVVHEDRPGIGRGSAVEAAEDEIFVDRRHRGAEAQDERDQHGRGQRASRYV